MVITCGALDEESISTLCREKGIFPHRVEQWKLDFSTGKNTDNNVKKPSDSRDLKKENKALKKELNGKEKALAEAAALLILQKKSIRCGERTRTVHYEK